LSYKEDWRQGLTGDWVLSDDGMVMEVLRAILKSGKRRNGAYILKTAFGSYDTGWNRPCTTEVGRDRHSITGTRKSDIGNLDRLSRDKLEQFVYLYAHGMQPAAAFANAFLKQRVTRKEVSQANRLLARPEVREMVKASIQTTLEKLGITDEYVLGKYKRLIDNAENEATTLGALNKLAEIVGLIGNKAVSPIQATINFPTADEVRRIREERSLRIDTPAEDVEPEAVEGDQAEG
jgi:hypothetical protein